VDEFFDHECPPTSAAYLALDPGKATGWATFDANGDGTGFGTVQGQEGLYELLDEKNPKVLIVEDFELFPWRAKDLPFDSLIAVLQIGAIDHWAWQHNVPVHKQKPMIKATGYMWAGIVKPKVKAMTHQTDAFAHGVYWLQRNGHRTPQQGKAKDEG
jgi:hypothetical protein